MNTTDDCTETAVERQQRELTEFVARAQKAANTRNEIDQWHMYAYLSHGVDLPYSSGDRTQYVTVRSAEDWDVIDVEATTKVLAKVVKAIRSRGYKVEKIYNESDFSLRFMLPVGVELKEDGTPKTTVSITYVAARSTVCTPKVVGTKIIPAVNTPAKVVDDVEWECDKVSFLGIDTDE